jgi:RNA polymerase sigma factor (sigma-70 family)
MTDSSGQSVALQDLLDRLTAGDESARDQLISHSYERLERLARSMLGRYPGVHRWEQTDDVLQGALMKLHHSLRDVKPESAPAFFGLAATQIRRILIDLARHYYGPEGLGANQVTNTPPAAGENSQPLAAHHDPANETSGPASLAEWSEFHSQIENLPDVDREVFNLLWYDGLSQAEAAAVLGISERTLKRRWREAKFKVYDALQSSRLDQSSGARIKETPGRE